MNKRQFGKKYEDFVALWLKKQGFTLICQNYSSPYGEADIIMKDGETFVFIEVKTRKTLRYGLPSEAVTKSKQKKYLLTAQYFFSHEMIDDYTVRFDVAEVLLHEETPYIHYIKSAFDFSGFDSFY